MTRFLTEYGLLIQHIPRCGGSWIERAIDILGIPYRQMPRRRMNIRRHALLVQYNWSCVANVKHVACFVRHPVAYYESAWKWMHANKIPAEKTFVQNWHPWRTAAREYEASDRTFPGWLRRILDRLPLWYTRMVEQYVGQEHGVFCDFIGRTETLLEDFVSLLQRFRHFTPNDIAKLIEIGKVNARKNHVQWDETLKNKVLSTERSVIERFYGDKQQVHWYANGDEAINHNTGA